MNLFKYIKPAWIFCGLGLSAILALLYFTFIALEMQPMPLAAIIEKYHYDSTQSQAGHLDFKGQSAEGEFSYNSFDGSLVRGRIQYPEQGADKYPVLIGIHAMGRSYPRWFTGSLKGRPTLTQVNKITALANVSGYAVVAIDARYHGSRKDPNMSLRSIMNDLEFFGNKAPYEAMIHDTVLDHRVLLDLLVKQPRLDSDNISLAGYSMGGQIAILFAAFDNRVDRVLAIVPPFLDDKTALVAPINVTSLLTETEILLLTASDDENATEAENSLLYASIPTINKKRIEFEGGHILPDDYVSHLNAWFDD